MEPHSDLKKSDTTIKDEKKVTTPDEVIPTDTVQEVATIPELPKDQDKYEAATESEKRPGISEIKQNTEVEKGSSSSQRQPEVHSLI